MLSDAARSAGVVGGGGAGFPTHIKVAAQVEIVIANGAECEPLLRVDQQLMARFPERLVEGMLRVKEATGARRAVIALKDKYKDAFIALKPFADRAGVELFALGAFYPAGDEVTLVYEVTGRVIPEAGLPLHVGCLVQNIHTLIWLDDATRDIPVTERFLTVGGAVRSPRTVLAPIGTLVEDVIEAAGGPSVEEFVVIDGGPMMGKFVTPQTSITKKTSGIIVFPADHYYVQKRTEHPKVSWQRAASACTVCEDCTKYCPRFTLGHRVLPHRAVRQMASTMSFDQLDEDGQGADNDHSYEPGHRAPMSGYALTGAICCECGICSLWSCPMDLRPREVMQMVKRRMIETKTPNPFRGATGVIHPAYDERKIPVDRIIKGLYLTDWDLPAPMFKELLTPRGVRIPLSQHVGVSSVARVRKGDRVSRGDLIAEIADNALGARVHASMNGVVTDVGDHVEIRAERN